MTAAPVSRSAAGSTPATAPRKGIRLSEGEAEAARVSMPDLFREDPAKCYQRYWEHKQALIREGKISA